MKQKLITVLELRKQQFVSRMRQAKDIAVNSARRIGNAFRNAGRKIASIKLPNLGGFGAFMGLGAVIGAITAAFGKTTQWAANLEQVSVAFETMMGSAEKARDMVRELTDFSTATPFEPGEVYEAGRALLSYGVAAKSVTSEMRMIGDLAAAINAPLNDMVNIYGKAMMKGKLQAEELNQLAERGVPIIQTLADKYGVTSDAIYQMAANGQISFNDLQEALKTMTQEGGIYFQSMQKQSLTLGGLISTTMGNIKNIGAAIADGWVPALKAAALWTNSVAAAMQKANDLKKQNKIKEEGGDGWLKSTSKLIADMGTFGHADDIANMILGPREVLSMKGDPKAKAYAERKRRERASSISSPTAPEAAAAAEKAAAQKAAADKQHRIDKSIDQQVVAKIADSGTAGNGKQQFIDKFIRAAEKIAANAGSKLSDAKRSQITDKAAALYDKKFEANATARYDDALKNMKNKLTYQRLIVAGKKKEAEISRAIAAAEKQMGRKMTPEELAKYKKTAAEIYDLKNADDKKNNNIPETAQKKLSDNLLRIGGMLGGNSAVKNIDKEKVSILKIIAKNTADIKIEGGVEIA